MSQEQAFNTFVIEEIRFSSAESCIKFYFDERDAIRGGRFRWGETSVFDAQGVCMCLACPSFEEPLIAIMDIERMLRTFTQNEQKIIIAAAQGLKNHAARLFNKNVPSEQITGIRQAERHVEDLLDKFEELLRQNDYLLFE